VKCTSVDGAAVDVEATVGIVMGSSDAEVMVTGDYGRVNDVRLLKVWVCITWIVGAG